jgi:hypothetical protein
MQALLIWFSARASLTKAIRICPSSRTEVPRFKIARIRLTKCSVIARCHAPPGSCPGPYSLRICSTDGTKEMHLTVWQPQLFDGMSNGCFARTGCSGKHYERAHSYSGSEYVSTLPCEQVPKHAGPERVLPKREVDRAGGGVRRSTSIPRRPPPAMRRPWSARFIVPDSQCGQPPQRGLVSVVETPVQDGVPRAGRALYQKAARSSAKALSASQKTPDGSWPLGLCESQSLRLPARPRMRWPVSQTRSSITSGRIAGSC